MPTTIIGRPLAVEKAFFFFHRLFMTIYMMSSLNVLATLPPAVRERVPDSDICATTLALAQELPAPILNHSLRVYLLARWLAESEEDTVWTGPEKLPLLFASAICHDLGAGDSYNGAQRFEVEGADAAKTCLLTHGVTESESHQVWTAIAVHTSPGIAERIDPLARLIRIAVKMDFSRSFCAGMGGTEYAASIEEQLPRLDVERALGDAVVRQAAKIPDKVDSLTWPSSQKHPSASWPGILLRAHLENPDYDGINPAF
jgi:hypothetical protein